MLKTKNDVKKFMLAGDQTEIGFDKQASLYMSLITEELIHELLKEFDNKNLVGIADGIVDSIVVIEGLANTLELSLDEIWKHVDIVTEHKTKLLTDDFIIEQIIIKYSLLRSSYRTKNVNQIIEIMEAILVSLIRLAQTLEIPLQDVWDEVSRSNFSKVDPESGKLIKREDGKILKGAFYFPPDIKSILIKHNLILV